MDWEITTRFYAALHLVNGYFRKNGIKQPKNHKKRNKVVKERLPLLYPKYHTLYHLSIKARYYVMGKVLERERHDAVVCFSVLNASIYSDAHK